MFLYTKKTTSKIGSMLIFPFFLTTFFIPLSTTEDSWATMEPMPTARGSFGVAVVDGKIYAIGGFNGSNYLAINEMYDPETDTWTTKQSMPTARHEFAIAVCQNKIYVIGGVFRANDFFNSGFTGVNEVYDPLTDTWETMEPMPTARARLQANVVDNKIYLIGGAKYDRIWPFYWGTAGLNEVYDPLTNSWSTNSPMPTSVGYYFSAVVDNKIYVMYAVIETSFLTQIYNSETDSWSYGKKLPTAAFVATAGATTGVLAPKRIYVLGGMVESNVATNLNQVYDPETDTWTNGTSMPTPRWALAVAVVNDELYAIGGYNGETRLAVNEKYTPIDYIPEFPSWTPMLVMLLVIAILTVMYKHRLRRANHGRKIK